MAVIEKKGRIFHSTLTREFQLLALLDFLISIFLVYQGVVNSRVIAIRGVPFIILGIIIFVLLIAVALHTLGRTLVITPGGIEHRHHSKVQTIPFIGLREFYPPSPAKKIFRSCLVGDGRQTLVIDSFSFQEFELIVNIIAVARKRAKENTTYRI